MRIPKPRLRQVFEHTTSFKVKKPTGQTITIAKKGLSPSTIGRLRRFAQGGEVQNYQVGGEVPPADEAGIQFEPGERARMRQPEVAPEALAQAAAPQPVETAEIPRAPRRVVAADAAQGSMTEDERRRQDFERLKQVSPAPAAAPAPVQVVVNAAPQPAPAAPVVPQPAITPVQPATAPAVTTQRVETASRRTEEAAPAAPAEPAPEPATAPKPAPATTPAAVQPIAPVEAELPEVGTALGPEFGYRPSLLGGRLEPIVAAPIPAALAKPTLAMPEVAAPTLPSVTPDEAAQFTEAPAPVATVAAAPSRPITAQALRDEAKKTPNATVADLVTRLGGVDAAIDPIVMQSAAAIPAVNMLRTGKLADAYVAGVAQELDAAKLEADARVEQARIEQEALNAERLRAAEKAKADIERAEALRTHSKQLEQEAMASDNLKSFFDSQGTAYSVLSLVSLAIGGFLSGYTNTPNYVLKAFNDAMDKDLEEQKRRRTSKWNRYKEVLGDADAADLLVRADNDQLASIAIKKASLQQNVAKIRPELERLQAQLQQRAALNMAALDLKLAQAEDKREPPAPKAVRGGKDSSVPEERLQLAKENAERERLLNVDGIPVRRSTRQRQAMTQSGVDRRIAYIENVARLEKALKDHGANIWNVLATERGDIISELALSLENSPQGFGYERAISRNAAVVLKEGMGSPTGVKAAVLKAFGRDPAAGIRALRQDTQRQLKQLLAGVADPSNQRDKDAAEYGQWKINNRIKRVLGEKEDPAPKLSTPTNEIVSLPPDSPLYRPPAAPAAAPTPSQMFTITNTKTGATKQTTDSATANRFRNQTGFTVTP